MRTARKLLWLLLAVGTIALAAEPALLELVMPDAKVVFGINIGKIAASPLGASIASQIEAAEPAVEKFVKDSGFNPARDLREIVIASTAEGTNPPTLVLAGGSFDVGRLSQFAKGAGEAMSYQGVPILAGPKKDSGVVAFLENSVVVMGPLEQVRQAIGRRGHAAGLSPNLAAKVRELSGVYDAWIVSTTPIGPLASQVPSGNAQGALQGDLLKSIETFSGGVKFGAVLEFSGELTAHTAKDAASLADTLRFLAGMLQANQGLALNVRANTVKLSLSLPMEQLRRAVQGTQTGVKPRAAADPAGGGLVIQSSPKDMGTVVVAPNKP